MDSRRADPVVLGPSARVIGVVEWLRLAADILVRSIRRLMELLHGGR